MGSICYQVGCLDNYMDLKRKRCNETDFAAVNTGYWLVDKS